MSFDSFYKLLTDVFVTLLNLIQRAATIHELISEIAHNCEKDGMKIGITSIAVTAGKAQDLNEQMRSSSKNLLASTPKRARANTRSLARKKMTEEIDDLGSFDEISVSQPGKSAANLFAAELNENNIPKQKDSESSGPSTILQNINESSDALFAACELAHIRCAKLLTIRAEQNTQLNSFHFFKLFGSTWEFLSASESLSGRMCFPLKGCILNQAKLYINHFHDEKSKQMALLIENEQWIQADIPIDFQHITEQLQLTPRNKAPYEDEEQDEEEEEEEEDLEFDLTASTITGTSKISASQSNLSGEKTLKYLQVDGGKYYVVGSVLMFLKTLTDYVTCAEKLPSLVPEILNRIIELLKVFNSRVCQVILGGAAMSSAGLKSITSRHIGTII